MHNEDGKSEFKRKMMRGLNSHDHKEHKDRLPFKRGGLADGGETNEPVLNRGLDKKRDAGAFKRGGYAEGGESSEEPMKRKNGGCFKRGGGMRKASGGETEEHDEPMKRKNGGVMKRAFGGPMMSSRLPMGPMPSRRNMSPPPIDPNRPEPGRLLSPNRRAEIKQNFGKVMSGAMEFLPHLLPMLLSEGGKVQKKAAGGVGKIRHGEAPGKGYID